MNYKKQARASWHRRQHLSFNRGNVYKYRAHASVERGADDTPYWRTLKKDGELNEKYPEGIDGQKFRLEMEGHTVIQKGKRYFVKDFKNNFSDWNNGLMKKAR